MEKSLREGELSLRQTQLDSAIKVFELMGVKPSLRELLRLSQILTDFQYSWNINNYEIMKFEKHFNQTTNETLLDSVPHVRTDIQDKQGKKTGVSEYQTAVAKQLKGKI